MPPLSSGQDECSVGVTNIPFGPLGILGGRGFFQRVAFLQAAIFGPSSLRAPTGCLDSELASDIQRRAINAGLPAGYQFFEHGC